MALQIPEYIRTIQPYVPGKPIEETRRETGLGRITKLASNENPLGPSPRALAAIKAGLRELHRYPDASAYRLKAALSAHLKVAEDWLIIGNGSNELIDMCIRTVCRPGEAMVTSQAAFVAYRICAQIHGVRTLEAALTPDLCFDLAAMAKLVRENADVRAVFIANPNNPTGTYSRSDELERFLSDVATIRGGSTLVVLDYAYWEYVTAGDLPEPLALARKYPNVIVLRTFSKIYGLAGLRIGYGVATPELIGNLGRVRQPFNTNSLALSAAVAALSDSRFVKRSRQVNAQGMRFWENALTRMGVPYFPSQGNFVLIDAMRGFAKTGGAIFEGCLSRGVIFRPVANYGLNHCLRISIGTEAENRRALQALEKEGSGTHHGAPLKPRRRK